MTMVERWKPVPGGTEVVAASDYDTMERVADDVNEHYSNALARIAQLEATVQLIMNTVAGWEFVPATDFQLISIIAHANNVPYSSAEPVAEPNLICPRCCVDRYKQACPRFDGCPMDGNTSERSGDAK
jgi:hypothetical protein